MELQMWASRALYRLWGLNPDPTDQFYITALCQNGTKGGLSAGFLQNATGKYRGTKRVTYERVDLSKLFKNIQVGVQGFEADSLYDLLPVLNAKYGLAFQKADFPDQAYDRTKLPITLTVTSVPTSPVYSGSFQLVVTQKPMPLSEIVTVMDHDGPKDRFPRINPLLVSELFYYGFDFTDFRDVLETFPQGYVHPNNSSSLTEVLNGFIVKSETSTPVDWSWSNSQTLDFDFNAAVCIYKGLTTGYTDANTSYTYCSVWSTPRAAGTTKGNLIFHYD